MCKKCGKNSCTGCGSNNGNMASLEAQLGELNETVTSLSNLLSPFLKGHPILLIEHADDIAQFDFATGKGQDDWALWALCDGSSHKSIRDNKMIDTPNFVDRFIVHAGGTYAVDAVGGAATVALTTAELPVHSHAITDPGHTHGITDPGHDHPVTDPGHNHAASAGSHTHDFTTDSSGDHYHDSIGSQLYDTGGGGSQSGPDLNANNTAFPDHQSAGAHTHTGTTDSASGSVSVDSAFTGIDVTDSFTGITADSANTGITATENEGGGTPHENLPPFFAACYVMLIG